VIAIKADEQFKLITPNSKLIEEKGVELERTGTNDIELSVIDLARTIISGCFNRSRSHTLISHGLSSVTFIRMICQLAETILAISRSYITPELIFSLPHIK
jgi:hypothetical protein